jgi:hypothetical protein
MTLRIRPGAVDVVQTGSNTTRAGPNADDLTITRHRRLGCGGRAIIEPGG